MSLNQEVIEQQIFEKIHSSTPYFPPPRQIFDVVTDVNEQPYRRFFRGRPSSNEPIVWEREAGYNTIRGEIKNPTRVARTGGPPCFQLPCSTILPCKSRPAIGSTQGCVFLSP